MGLKEEVSKIKQLLDKYSYTCEDLEELGKMSEKFHALSTIMAQTNTAPRKEEVLRAIKSVLLKHRNDDAGLDLLYRIAIKGRGILYIPTGRQGPFILAVMYIPAKRKHYLAYGDKLCSMLGAVRMLEESIEENLLFMLKHEAAHVFYRHTGSSLVENDIIRFKGKPFIDVKDTLSDEEMEEFHYYSNIFFDGLINRELSKREGKAKVPLILISGMPAVYQKSRSAFGWEEAYDYVKVSPPISGDKNYLTHVEAVDDCRKQKSVEPSGEKPGTPDVGDVTGGGAGAPTPEPGMPKPGEPEMSKEETDSLADDIQNAAQGKSPEPSVKDGKVSDKENAIKDVLSDPEVQNMLKKAKEGVPSPAGEPPKDFNAEEVANELSKKDTGIHDRQAGSDGVDESGKKFSQEEMQTVGDPGMSATKTSKRIYKKGDRVRIITGPNAGVVGVIMKASEPSADGIQELRIERRR